MRYLPILDELFHSNSFWLLLLGLAVSLAAGARIKRARSFGIAAMCSAAVYLLCEVLSNLRTNFLLEILLVFIGTAAIGSALGFLTRLIAAMISSKSSEKSDI